MPLLPRVTAFRSAKISLLVVPLALIFVFVMPVSVGAQAVYDEGTYGGDGFQVSTDDTDTTGSDGSSSGASSADSFTAGQDSSTNDATNSPGGNSATGTVTKPQITATTDSSMVSGSSWPWILASIIGVILMISIVWLIFKRRRARHNPDV